MTVRSFSSSDRFGNSIGGKYDVDTGLVVKITRINNEAVDYDIAAMEIRWTHFYHSGINWADAPLAFTEVEEQVNEFYDNAPGYVSESRGDIADINEFVQDVDLNAAKSAGLSGWLWFLPISLILGKVFKIY